MAAKSASRSFLFAIDTLAEGTPARLKVFVGAVQMKDFSAALSPIEAKTMCRRSVNLMSQ